MVTWLQLYLDVSGHICCWFVQGYSGGLLYDGQYMANTTSTIIVTINYRLGAMGFLVYGEGDDMPQGNYGIRVRAWVR